MAHARVRSGAVEFAQVVLMQLTDCVSSPYPASCISQVAKLCDMRTLYTGQPHAFLLQRLRAHHFHQHSLPCVKDLD